MIGLSHGIGQSNTGYTGFMVLLQGWAMGQGSITQGTMGSGRCGRAGPWYKAVQNRIQRVQGVMTELEHDTGQTNTGYRGFRVLWQGWAMVQDSLTWGTVGSGHCGRAGPWYRAV